MPRVQLFSESFSFPQRLGFRFCPTYKSCLIFTMADMMRASSDVFGLFSRDPESMIIKIGLLEWNPQPEEKSMGSVPQSSTSAFKQGTPAHSWSDKKKQETDKRINAAGQAIPASETGATRMLKRLLVAKLTTFVCSKAPARRCFKLGCILPNKYNQLFQRQALS